MSKTQKEEPCDLDLATSRNTSIRATIKEARCKNCSSYVLHPAGRSTPLMASDPGCTAYGTTSAKQHFWGWKNKTTADQVCRDCGEDYPVGATMPAGPCVPKNLAASTPPASVPSASVPGAWTFPAPAHANPYGYTPFLGAVDIGLDPDDPANQTLVLTRPVKPRGRHGNCSDCDRELVPYLDAVYDKDFEGLCSRCQPKHARYLKGLRGSAP